MSYMIYNDLYKHICHDTDLAGFSTRFFWSHVAGSACPWPATLKPVTCHTQSPQPAARGRFHDMYFLVLDVHNLEFVIFKSSNSSVQYDVVFFSIKLSFYCLNMYLFDVCVISFTFHLYLSCLILKVKKDNNELLIICVSKCQMNALWKNRFMCC